MSVVKQEKKRGKPARIDIRNGTWASSGITIEYVKSTKTFYISGWYDNYVGIEGAAISKDELFKLLEIE